MNPADIALAHLFVAFSREKLINQYRPRLRKAVAPLSHEQVWWRPNPASNSIGNLVLHLEGNVRQWLVASFNQQEDARNRPAEFKERRRLPVLEILDKLDATLAEADRVLERLTPEELDATYQIQGYTVTGLGAVYQVVEHFALHYGQVLYAVKALTGQDLGFYRELNADGRLHAKNSPAQTP